MKILLTGATGFLGKHLLEILLNDERISSIDIVSRRKRTHPSAKAKTISIDLSDPSSVNDLTDDFNAVIHLAGLYDFRESLSNDYSQNVLPTLNLVEKLKEWNKKRCVPLYFASSYGVGFGIRAGVAEEPLIELPSKRVPYAYTKAIAERAITDAKIPGAIFRLGILVGSSKTGAIEKIDGPYALMKALQGYKSSRIAQTIPVIPIPAKRAGILPLVPVDVAAEVFHEAVFRNSGMSEPARIFGVYESTSVEISRFCEFIVAAFTPWAKPLYLEDVPSPALKVQEFLTGIPHQTFMFSLEPIDLRNERFVSEYSSFRIPHFDTYRNVFLKGFEDFSGGRF